MSKADFQTSQLNQLLSGVNLSMEPVAVQLPEELRTRLLVECASGDHVFIGHEAIRVLPDGTVYVNMKSAFSVDNIAGFIISARCEENGAWTLWIPDCLRFSPMKAGPNADTWQKAIQHGDWRPVVEIQVQVGYDDVWEDDDE